MEAETCSSVTCFHIIVFLITGQLLEYIWRSVTCFHIIVFLITGQLLEYIWRTRFTAWNMDEVKFG
jgi:hypothetical protein